MDKWKDKEDLLKQEEAMTQAAGAEETMASQSPEANGKDPEPMEPVHSESDGSNEQAPTISEDEAAASSAGEEDEMIFFRRKIKNLEDENKKLGNELDAFKDRLTRLSAEYDNYRKRSAREKEELSAQCTSNLLKDIIPVIDNLERALISETDDLPGLKDGVQMTLDQFVQAMQRFGVEEIPTDQPFDPHYHEAVMHEVDDNKGEKEISEVFLRGYKIGDKVIRHTVVKVAN
ncbi:nucleotide exchange factor GrpE [Proteiniclasticum sp. QWL-01]|uniref:nucleotide exchange factor GrpE n=1 Tax=Proteiniclasticum sp. QWL-01 TaxID=3036945 RepID=UPI00241101A1|nr:nucleotide exchange factor GrpE [Proteiniclasticum sp. QWL-01]WFF74116.1 nucleotide exchange factor GrpE [Proteiniclasticum sp. QWL-01]